MQNSLKLNNEVFQYSETILPRNQRSVGILRVCFPRATYNGSWKVTPPMALTDPGTTCHATTQTKVLLGRGRRQKPIPAPEMSTGQHEFLPGSPAPKDGVSTAHVHQLQSQALSTCCWRHRACVRTLVSPLESRVSQNESPTFPLRLCFTSSPARQRGPEKGIPQTAATCSSISAPRQGQTGSPGVSAGPRSTWEQGGSTYPQHARYASLKVTRNLFNA